MSRLAGHRFMAHVEGLSRQHLERNPLLMTGFFDFSLL